MKNLEWQKQTTTFEYLDKQADKFPLEMSMVTWLRLIGVIPLTVEWQRGNRLPNTNLDPRALSAGYLAEFAYDWNKDGRTTARDFVDALAFEVSGRPEKLSVSEVLAELKAEGAAWLS